jgi:hypothetical protein
MKTNQSLSPAERNTLRMADLTFAALAGDPRHDALDGHCAEGCACLNQEAQGPAPHPKALHGQCPVCGHYGEDCAGDCAEGQDDPAHDSEPQDSDVPPDPEGENDRRAEEAEEVLNQYESAFGEPPYGGISQDQLADLREQNLADLLCNFGHFCDRNGVDMQAVIRRAKMHYDEETAHEGVQFTVSN